METSTNTPTQENSFTFKVEDVEPNKNLNVAGFPLSYVLVQKFERTKKRFDDFSHKNDKKTKILHTGRNGLMSAAHYAYVNHYPLKISVSDFILMIGQGLAKHVEVHAEEVRPYFVNHEGKEKITIIREDFKIEGGNDWSTVFGEFALGVKQRVKTDFYDIMIDDTSVATKLSKISSEIAIMDTFKHYFEYKILLGCAMTEVTLVGSPDDWEKLRTKVRKLKEFNTEDRLQLDWWLEKLVPLVDTIVDQAVSRKIDREFWSKIYQSQDKKGFYEPTPLINGWLNIFNPYLLKYDKPVNFNYTRKPVRSNFESIHPDELMSGVSQAPVLMQNIQTGQTYPITVYGGFLGAKLNEDGTVGTEYFYATTFDDCPENKDIKGMTVAELLNV